MAKRTKKLIESNEVVEEIRINKFLSDAGVCSRREADKYISEGKVTIDGITAVMGSKVKSGQQVMLAGKPVDKDEALALIAFNKPRGIVCTTDKREKDNIIEFIQYGKRIYPIGRLDKESEGLILLTNDGNIVNRILRAGNNHEKEYIVTVNKAITAEFLKGMAAGVPILDTVTRPCEIKALDKVTFQIILTQGLNRQIRRMCEYFDYKVLTLKRTRIMNINLGHMQVGGYRNVTEKEIGGLNELISNSVNTPDTLWNSMEDASDEEPMQKSKRTYKSLKTTYKNPVNKKADYKSSNNKNSDSKKMDSNKSDYKSSNNENFDSKKIDSNKSDYRSSNNKNSDSKKMNSSKSDYRSSNNKNSDSKKVDSNKSDYRSSNNKNSDSKKMDSNKSDYRSLNNKNSDSKKMDSNKSDYRSLNNKNSDSKKVDSNKSDYKSSDNKNSTRKNSDYKKNDNKKPDTKTASKKSDYKKRDSNKMEVDSTEIKNSYTKSSSRTNVRKTQGQEGARTESKSKPTTKSKTGYNKNADSKRGQSKSGSARTGTSDKSYKKFEKSPSRGRR
jgi:23S rRNA pseudouridine2604 synthase